MRIADASRKIREDVLVICHGGPFDEPEIVAEAMRRMPGINGFYGATSMEILPVERAIKAQVEKFTQMKTIENKLQRLNIRRKIYQPVEKTANGLTRKTALGKELSFMLSSLLVSITI